MKWYADYNKKNIFEQIGMNEILLKSGNKEGLELKIARLRARQSLPFTIS